MNDRLFFGIIFSVAFSLAMLTAAQPPSPDLYPTQPHAELNGSIDLPEDKSRYAVRKAQIQGVEHAFFFCESGESGPIVEGQENLVPVEELQNAYIECAGAKILFHTHPTYEDVELSKIDESTLARSTWTAVCAASMRGHVVCDTQQGIRDPFPTVNYEKRIVVNDSYQPEQEYNVLQAG